MSTISFNKLTKRYGSVLAVDDLSFDVHPGKVTGFLGPNGSGKTSTLRILLGLAAPTSGTATIDGLAYRQLPDPVRQVGAALDSNCFHPGRSAAQHERHQRHVPSQRQALKDQRDDHPARAHGDHLSESVRDGVHPRPTEQHKRHDRRGEQRR